MTTSSLRPREATRRLSAGGAVGERRDGLVAGVEQAHRLVDPGQLEQPPDVGVRAADAEAPLVVVELALRLDQQAEPGRVDEAAVAEIDEDAAVGPSPTAAASAVAQLRRGALIELAGNADRVQAMSSIPPRP